MKKTLLIFLFGLLLSLSACTNTDNDIQEQPEEKEKIVLPETLKDAVTTYQSKLNTIIDNDQVTLSGENILTRFYNNTPYDPDDMLPRETYLDVYNNQIDNSNHVYLTEYLRIYKELLDELYTELEAYDIDDLEANISISYTFGQTMDAYVYLSADKGVVVKFETTSVFSEEPINIGIKLGYENDIFFVKEFKHYTIQDSYHYFEFLENVSLIEIDYRDEYNFRYSYKNQVNNEDFDLYLSSNAYGPDDYVLRWFNPETNIRTIYADGYEAIRHFEQFNEKTSIFSYTDYLDGNIALRFQLLEATGWDYAYLDSNAHPNQGVYFNNVMLFEEDEYRQFNVDLNPEYGRANVGVTIDISKDELTNDILNLNKYGMDFNHPEITVQSIATTIETLYEESKSLAVYRGIDFYSGNVKDELYEQMDEDIVS
ncbi:hypothetical protein BK010_04875 [Tenericutes bacterium MO-XQ]|nr:hypothetical protein BK010_04875 [Tenericutes bacterium MO-XQ]